MRMESPWNYVSCRELDRTLSRWLPATGHPGRSCMGVRSGTEDYIRCPCREQSGNGNAGVKERAQLYFRLVSTSERCYTDEHTLDRV